MEYYINKEDTSIEANIAHCYLLNKGSYEYVLRIYMNKKQCLRMCFKTYKESKEFLNKFRKHWKLVGRKWYESESSWRNKVRK